MINTAVPSAHLSSQGMTNALDVDASLNIASSSAVPAEDLFGALLNNQLALAAYASVITESGVAKVPGIAEGEQDQQIEAAGDRGTSDAVLFQAAIVLQPPILQLSGLQPSVSQPSVPQPSVPQPSVQVSSYLQFVAAIPDNTPVVAPDVGAVQQAVAAMVASGAPTANVKPAFFSLPSGIAHDVAPSLFVTAPAASVSRLVVTQDTSYAKSIVPIALGLDAEVSVDNLSGQRVGEPEIPARQETAAEELHFAALALKNAVTEKDSSVQSDTASDILQLPQGMLVTTGAIIQQHTGTAQTSHALPSSAIQTPVASNAWGGSLGEKVVWMVGQQHQGVELHLNPPALGPLEVRVSVSDGQANLNFMTQHLPVRDAIESAMSRLREVLAENGIGLGSVSVNLGTFTQQQPSGNPPEPSFARWNAVPSPVSFTTAPVATARQPHPNAMVDTFA